MPELAWTLPCPTLLGASSLATSVACQLDADYNFAFIVDVPTTAQMDRICKSAACAAVLAQVRSAAPAECTLASSLSLYQDIITPIETQCQPSIEADAVMATASAPMPVGTAAAGTATTVPTSAPSGAPGGASYPSVQVSATPETTSSGVTTIVGIVIGILVVGLAVSLGAWWHFKKARRRRPLEDAVGEQPYARTAHSPAAAAAGPLQPRAPKTPQQESPQTTLVAPPSRLWTDPLIVAARVPLDDVQIGKKVSSGGFGAVYRGQFRGEPVAIKRLRRDHRGKTMFTLSLLEEAKLMSTLRHERIIKFLGVAWESTADVHVLSRFMEGGDLYSTLKRFDRDGRPMGFDRTKLKIARHVAQALVFLHNRLPVILHRDLKSQNILLTDEMDAVVTDFGLTRFRAEHTMTQGVGTSLWMAPEVVTGGRYNEKADIFSFGVVLSELDSNRKPYALAAHRDRTSFKLQQLVALGLLTVEFSETTHAALAELGMACVALDPKDRPTAEEVLARIDAVWNESPDSEHRTADARQENTVTLQ